MLLQDRVSPPSDSFKSMLNTFYTESCDLPSGHVFFKLEDLDGNVIAEWGKKNLITLDAGILTGMQIGARPANRGLYMLAVGTGATGSLLNPDIPDPRQRKLNAEIARKAFSSIVFRNPDGSVSAIPTNVMDYTVQFGSGEAVGPLNEMGLISPVSTNPLTLNPNPDTFPSRDVSRDLTQYDILFNYLTFGVQTKPTNSILTITWRLTH